MRSKTLLRSIARVLILSLSYQLIYPNVTYALPSGPSQPEVQSFEPVGTTDMVDLFSGDFVYNIPLLDVDGYPINIAYHSGVNIEQEASWVGLGWNINPGVVNRAVRGLPDDFNDDLIERKVHIQDEKNVKVAAGGNVELLGYGFNLSAGIYVNSNNYKGLSVGMNTGASISAFGFASAGVNMGISSQGGADIDYDAGIGYSTSQTMSREFSAGVGLNGSGGYNSRSGAKDFTINVTANYRAQYSNKKVSGSGSLFTATLPIALQNYVPVITNASKMRGFGASIGLGGELYSVYLHGYLGLTLSKLSYDGNGNRNGFGYLYLQNAKTDNIMDFTRDKDGMFNKTMQYLPAGNTTYDVYSVSAQGTGGIFRPFRNDYGFVYDPKMQSDDFNENVGLEVGLGNTLEVGGNYQSFETEMKSGPWMDAMKSYSGKSIDGSLYENVYFKQAGELTEVPQSFYSSIQGSAPLAIAPGNGVPATKSGRDARGNLIYFLTNDEASRRDQANNQFAFSNWQLDDYKDPTGLINGPNTVKVPINRMNNTTRKKDRIAEIIQVNKDGSRYIYGLPAMNDIQKEVTFSVNGSGADLQQGLTTYSATDDGLGNSNDKEQFYSMTVTPAYAHSYMLTNVLSTDYVDVGNDGPTDDDLGTYVKFNYSRKDSTYRWRVPYDSGKANYSPGFYADKQDDKASYVIGSKEQWYVHSMETKHFVAEFYTSKRDDAKGVIDSILPNNSFYKKGIYSSADYNKQLSQKGSSYKLDSIKLYNKHDRFLNKAAAIPVKSVYFEYNYSLCPGTPNSDAAPDTTISGHPGKGKLTLKKIYISYGNSAKNLLSPYQFDYHQPASIIPYSVALKDRWGNYKPNNPQTPNFEFPYVSQDTAANNDEYAKMWQLTHISLPSGGNLNIQYESDDYAYVQDRRAMEMFKVAAVGATPDYNPNEYTLYQGKNSPFNYIYFNRRTSAEFSSNLWEVYLNNEKTIYYNFGLDITSKGKYESVKGYAEVEAVGPCSDGIHGYVKLKAKKPYGANAELNPIVYTGLNMARYYLPHLFYPGSDPNVSALENVLRGLAAAGKELLNMFKNPIEQFVKQNKAKNYDKNRSFVRLYNPNLKKKGGGSRVKELRINDAWNSMAGQNSADAEYGNKYEYTIQNNKYGTISSGVASYEPMAGGDENPFRQPASYYKATNGSNFPPNDPVELYQEDPVGESLFPSASVGYSLVRVTSIHKDKARSAQTEDDYEFYTAKDFPIRVEATAIDKDEETSQGLFQSKIHLTATQAYSIIMNDMHGKPKTIANFALRKDDNGVVHKEQVTRQEFLYNASGNKLNNNVQTLAMSGGKVLQTNKRLGEEIDITVDSRMKEENTRIANVQANLNVFIVWVIPIPIPTAFWPKHYHERSFKSLVSTKVVQQYGILKAVRTIREGATTLAENIAYDPNSGEVLLTKVNNEYGDPEYNTNSPAYWAYEMMGPSYQNVLVEDSVDIKYPIPGLLQMATQHASSYHIGDELLIHTMYCKYLPGAANIMDKYFKAWVVRVNAGANRVLIQGANKNFIPQPTAGAVTRPDDVRAYVKILRSGYRNQLTAPIQTTTSLDNPVQGGVLSFSPKKVINTKVTTYSDTLNPLFAWHVKVGDTVTASDTNAFLFGYRGNFRVANEYVYFGDRDYSKTHVRADGTYPIQVSFWMYQNGVRQNNVINLPSLFKYWKLARSVTKYNIYGNEIENQDALGIPSSALFGFNHTHPVAVANNAKYYEVLSEGFEDYRLLQKTAYLNTSNAPAYTFSPFRPLFAYSNPAALSPSTSYKYYDTTATNLAISRITSHTGVYSLKVTSSPLVLTVTTSPNFKLNKFTVDKVQKYIFSCWVKPQSGTTISPITVTQFFNATQLTSATVTLAAKTNIIDGWVLYEGEAKVDMTATSIKLNLPAGYFYDDLRVFPSKANMKAFVYNSLNQRLIATLDENNFATFYEYDNEGQLVRVNKETERGIMTVQESRRANVKIN